MRKPRPPTENALLEAMLAARPLPPGPEWQTLRELHAHAVQRGEKITVHAVRHRLQELSRKGQVERLRAPRRGLGTGVAVYYRLKGKP